MGPIIAMLVPIVHVQAPAHIRDLIEQPATRESSNKHLRITLVVDRDRQLFIAQPANIAAGETNPRHHPKRRANPSRFVQRTA
jgi:hypothetical protein